MLPVGGDTETTSVEDYWQELILSLSSVRETAQKEHPQGSEAVQSRLRPQV